ncbi:MAG: flagellar biosynthesis protein FliA, partial [Synergistaceae bacterium]|nr:flagellar biosynthesis protein FliA [Synergistaceae bacterium]
MSLDAERERELWRKCADGDMTAREELIVSYRPLVFWIASKITVYDAQLRQDMIQEGMLALI